MIFHLMAQLPQGGGALQHGGKLLPRQAFTGGQHLQFRFPFAPAPDVGRRALQKAQGQQQAVPVKQLCVNPENRVIQERPQDRGMGTCPPRREQTQQYNDHNTPSQPGQETTEHRIAVPVLQRGADQQSGDGKTEHDPGVDGKIGKERDHRLKSRHDPIDQRGQDGERRKGFLPFFHTQHQIQSWRGEQERTGLVQHQPVERGRQAKQGEVLQVEVRRLAQGSGAEQQDRPRPGPLQPAIQEQAQRQQKDHPERGGGKGAEAGIRAGLFVEQNAVQEIQGRLRVLLPLVHNEGEGFTSPFPRQGHIQIARARRELLKGSAIQPQLRRRKQLPNLQNRAQFSRLCRESIFQLQRACVEVQPVQLRRTAHGLRRQAHRLLIGNRLRRQQPHKPRRAQQEQAHRQTTGPPFSNPHISPSSILVVLSVTGKIAAVKGRGMLIGSESCILVEQPCFFRKFCVCCEIENCDENGLRKGRAPFSFPPWGE